MAKRQPQSSHLPEEDTARLHDEAVAIALRLWPEVIEKSRADLAQQLAQAWQDARQSIAEFQGRLETARPAEGLGTRLVASCRIAMEIAHGVADSPFSVEADPGASRGRSRAALRRELEGFIRGQLDRNVAYWGWHASRLVRLDAWAIESRCAWRQCENGGHLWELENRTPPALIRAYRPGGGAPWVAAYGYASAVRADRWERVQSLEWCMWHPDQKAELPQTHPHIPALVAGLPAMFIRPPEECKKIGEEQLSIAELGELRAGCIHLAACMGGHGGGTHARPDRERQYGVAWMREQLGISPDTWGKLCQAAGIKISRGRGGALTKLGTADVLKIAAAARAGKFLHGEAIAKACKTIVEKPALNPQTRT